MYTFQRQDIIGAGYGGMQSASTGGGFDDLKLWLEQETLGVKRKYLALGALGAGLLYYGYKNHWF